jgi:hypothetical protein
LATPSAAATPEAGTPPKPITTNETAKTGNHFFFFTIFQASIFLYFSNPTAAWSDHSPYRVFILFQPDLPIS